MKQGKLEGMIKSVKMRIEWEQENIERCMKEIKEKAAERTIQETLQCSCPEK